MHHAIGTGGLCEECLSIDSQHRHDGASHGLARLYRLHEHILAAVKSALDEHAKIRHHDQATVFR